jgi:hypothetical protein
MGVVVTLKALARNRSEAAEGLFARALERVHATDVDGSWQLAAGSWQINTLLDHLETNSPHTAELVARTRHLSQEVLGE